MVLASCTLPWLCLVVAYVFNPRVQGVVDTNSREYQQRYGAPSGGGMQANGNARQADGYGYGNSNQQARGDQTEYQITCTNFDSSCLQLHRIQYAELPRPGWRCYSNEDCGGGNQNHCNSRTGKCNCRFLGAGPDCKNWWLLHKEWEFIVQRDGLPANQLPDGEKFRDMLRGVPLKAVVSTMISQWALVQDPHTSERDTWVRKKLKDELEFVLHAGLHSLEGSSDFLDLTMHLDECMQAVNTGVTWATKNLLRFNQMEQVLHEGIEEYGEDWFYELIPIILEQRNHPNTKLDLEGILQNHNNHTLLSLAAHGAYYGAMEVLLDYGANPTDQSMLRCVRMGDVKCLKILIDAGADPFAKDAQDEWGRSPLEVARLNQHLHFPKTFDFLVSNIDRSNLPQDFSFDANEANIWGKYDAPSTREVTCDTTGECRSEFVGERESVYIPRADVHLKKRCPIQVVDARQMSQEEFRRDFWMLGKPVIIRHATDNWPATEMWSDDYLIKNYGETMMTVGEIPYGDRFGRKYRQMSMREYINYIQEQEQNPDNESPLYIFDSSSLDSDAWTNPEFRENSIREGIDTPLVSPTGGRIPPEFHHSKYKWMADGPLHDYYGAVMHEGGTRWHQWYIGPPETGAPFHFHCQAFNTLTHGRKLWMLFSPSHPNMGMTYANLHPVKWLKQAFGAAPEIFNDNSSNPIGPIVCEQYENETLFIPGHWTHATINLETSRGFAAEVHYDC